MHFSEIIIIDKLQFGKELHTLLCILKLFTNIVDKLSFKNTWLPRPTFFLDFNNTCRDLLFPHIYKLCKNTFVSRYHP